MHEDQPTLSPRKRRRQAYSKLIRLFLENTRERLDTIRDVIKDESELHFRLTSTPLNEISKMKSNDLMTPNNEMQLSDGNSDTQNRHFIDFAFADATNINESSGGEKVESATADNSREYLNSLFAAVGYSRITTTTPNPMEYDETSHNSIISRYFLKPVLSIWNTTRQRFYSNNENDKSSFNENNSTSDRQTAVFRVNFTPNDTIKPKIHTNLKNTSNNMPHENRADNFNYYLPLIWRIVTNNVTSVMPTNETTPKIDNRNNMNASNSMLDVDYIGDDRTSNAKKTRNTHNFSTEDAAAAAFRIAFLKYSNSMQHSMEYAKTNKSNVPFIRFDRNATSTQDNLNIGMTSGKLLDGTFLTSNLFDTNSSYIQIVPNKKRKTNNSMGESITISDGFDDSVKLNDKSFGKNAGILILEIFGTIIGMTWQAISEIPNYFQHHNSNQ